MWSYPSFFIFEILYVLFTRFILCKTLIVLQPQPPVMRRKSNNDESYDVYGNASEGPSSKHQLKKERRQARKERKRQKGGRAEGETTAKENIAKKNSSESGKFL
jgi:hypothetical protein